jgi:hypothetical protein
MLTPIIGKRRKHKSFNYQPRYYNPEKDPAVRAGKRIRVESKVRRGQGRSVILIASILFILLYVFVNL